MKNKVYLIGIGGIGVSALARYYKENGWEVYGSDKTDSEIIENLKNEGIDVIIGESGERLEDFFNNVKITEKLKENKLVIYTEAIPEIQEEFKKAKELGIKILTYPKALAEIANSKKLITIAGSHGKSTTTSLISLIFKDSELNFNSIVGSLLKEFGQKNFFHRYEAKIANYSPEFFIIEACEYKRSFLAYKPFIGIITNIDLDHLDYYKNLDDYTLAFEEYIDNIVSGGYAILNGEDKNCRKLLGLRKDIKYVEIYKEYFIYENEIHSYPNIKLQIPGEHILFDAKIAYVVGHMLGIIDEKLLQTLKNYSGIWRRMEIIGKTKNNNTIMSDYGHHPTEIKLTLKALKDQNPARPILTIFQPHQYNRTLELLEDFKTCFYDTDKLIIPDIYESRDTKEDKNKINSKILVEHIKHDNKEDGNGFDNTLKLIEKWDNENQFGLILLLGAGSIDDLRYKIKTPLL